MLKCSSCGVEKEDSEFPKKQKEVCKRCKCREAEKKYKGTGKGKLVELGQRQKKKEAGYQLNYYRNNEKYREQVLARHKQYARENKEKIRQQINNYIAENPEKHRARNKLRKAVQMGKIEKPSACQKCGVQSKRIEGHHEDYGKPLDVIWLCVSCHKNLHGKIGGAL